MRESSLSFFFTNREKQYDGIAGIVTISHEKVIATECISYENDTLSTSPLFSFISFFP